MGRIPGFTNTIFPAAAMPNLSLVANLGLILFLFLVGLEVDLRFLISNWKVAVSVGLAGMALPFGLGCGIAWGLYNEFRHEPGTVPINFGTYMLFIGVAMAITVGSSHNFCWRHNLQQDTSGVHFQTLVVLVRIKNSAVNAYIANVIRLFRCFAEF
jgi:hypothetical protein